MWDDPIGWVDDPLPIPEDLPFIGALDFEPDVGGRMAFNKKDIGDDVEDSSELIWLTGLENLYTVGVIW